MTITLVLVAAILVVAVLYSSVGHAGASGYLAAMALAGLAPETMKPTALVLNVCVGTIGAVRFARAGHFSWSTAWPFLLAAFPLAFVGGRWQLPGHVYKPLVGVVLLVAGLRLIQRALHRPGPSEGTREPSLPRLPVSLAVGGAIGLLAGLTGTGGGIFLSPLLVLSGWASPKRTAAVTVVFVLINSLSGLAGHLSSLRALPAEIPWYVLAAVVGGLLGSGLGAQRLPSDGVRGLLGVVLLVAAAKMFLTAG